MPSGAQVGTAWVSIVPSFQGFASSIQSDLSGSLVRAGASAGNAGGEAAAREFDSSFSSQASSLADSFSGVGTLAGGTVAGAFAVGLTNAMDTSAANARLTAQLGLTEAEAERVGAVAGDVFADGFGGSIDEVNAAVAGVASGIGDLGTLSDTELQEMTTAALGVADVFQWDVGEAATAAGQLIRQGLVDDGTEAFDVMTRAAQALPSAMIQDIPAVISEYGIHFDRLGLDAQTAFGLMSQYVQAGGRDIDQAADVLHEFGRITTEETDRAASAFEALGLDSEEMLAAIHEGGPAATTALTETLGALRGMDNEAQASALAVELFGDMAGEGAEALWAMDPATAAVSAGLDDVSGASGELTDSLADSTAQQAASAFRTLATSLGDLLLPVLTSVAEFATNHPTLFRVIAGAVLVAAVAFTVLSVALWAVNAAVYANPITWIIMAIIAAIALLVAAIVVTIVYWDEIVAAVVAAWEWIQEATGAAVEWLSNLLSSTWEAISSGAQAAWTWLGDIISGTWGWIRSTTQAAWTWLTTTISSLWSSITSGARAAWNWIANLISSTWDTIINTVFRVSLRIGTTILNAWNRVRSITSSAFAAVRNAISNALTGAYNAVRNIGSWFVTLGRNIVTGIIRGVTSAASSLYNSLRNLASNALNAARNWLGIGSPSRVFADEIGQWIPAGVEVGIDSRQGELDRRIDHLVRVPDVPTLRTQVPAVADLEPRSQQDEVVDLLAQLLRAVREQDGDVVIQVDSQEIARATERGQRQLARR